MSWAGDVMERFQDPAAGEMPWTAPTPARLAGWRRKLVAYLGTSGAAQDTGMTLMIENGARMVPLVKSPFQAAAVLNAQERVRLEQARLYLVDGVMTGVVVRKRDGKRKTPLRENRVPTRNGLMVFSAPVDSYTALRVREDGTGPVIPYVMVSWGVWEGGFAPVVGEMEPAPEVFAAGLDPTGQHWGSPLLGGTGEDAILIGESEATTYWLTAWVPSLKSGTPVVRASETVLQDGQVLAAGNVPGWARATVAAWDLITQGKELGDRYAITREERVVQKPTDVRADRRRGILDDGAVSVVSAARRARPPAPRKSGSGTGTPYTHRRLVGQHTKSHCMNPRAHASLVEAGQECRHEDREILDHWAGDPSLPISDTVHVLR